MHYYIFLDTYNWKMIWPKHFPKADFLPKLIWLLASMLRPKKINHYYQNDVDRWDQLLDNQDEYIRASSQEVFEIAPIQHLRTLGILSIPRLPTIAKEESELALTPKVKLCK